MPLRFITSLTIAGMLLPGLASSGDLQPLKGVVELFTAQGCSSCPPADAAFEKLVRQGDVVALAYHVDYWDYLGWTDTLGSRENTERQYAYASGLGRSNVYTPQAVVNGRDHLSGADLDAINHKLDGLKSAGRGLTVPVKAELKDGELDIDIGAGIGKADVVVAYFTRKQSVEVLKGENKGRKALYWHSVYDVQTVGIWDGRPLRVTLPSSVMNGSKKDGCAVLLQTSTAGGAPSAIIGATMLIPNKNH